MCTNIVDVRSYCLSPCSQWVHVVHPTLPFSFHLFLPYFNSLILFPSLLSPFLPLPPSLHFLLFLLLSLYAEPPVFCDGVPEWRRSHVPHPSLTQIQTTPGKVLLTKHDIYWAAWYVIQWYTIAGSMLPRFCVDCNTFTPVESSTGKA